MSDIADIGFRVDTADLEKAVARLNALKPAAAGVSTAATKMANAVEGASATVSSANIAIAKAELSSAQATVKRLQATTNATAEEKKAAASILRTAEANYKAAQSERDRVAALREIARAQKENNRLAFAAGANTSFGGTRPSGPRMVVNNGQTLTEPNIPRDMMPNRFNTANLAAQFQDIGVTAAMGMNPLMIAIQQGTQLSAIMNSMEKPLQGLAIAFKSVFNAISLGTIAIVALVAAGLQMINWTSVAKSALNGLADVIQLTTPYIMGLGAALALLYSRTIIAGIASLSMTFLQLSASALATGVKIAASWLIAMGPVGWAIAGVLSVAAAFQAFGVDAVGYMKSAANGIIGALVGAFNAVKATWKTLPAVMGDIIIQTANTVLGKIGDLINSFIGMINGLLDNLPDWAKPEGGKITWKADVQIDNPFEGQAAAAGKIAGEEFAKAFRKDYVGKAVDFAQGIGNAAANGIRDFASGIGKEDEKKKRGKTEAERYEDVVRGAERRIATLKAEQQAIGMTEEATARLKYETELLNQAQQKNITLTPTQRAELGKLAAEMASIEERTRVTKEAYDLLRDSAKSFVSDLRSGLAEGRSLWESFGNAVVNVLNKIADRLINSGIDALFSGTQNSGGGSGLLGTIGSSIGSLFATNAGTQVYSSAAAVGPFMAAKGGVFTNSIVGQATPFMFASGGAFGVMGEAGPEAVMPLHRGPDGSLGVKANGANDNGGSVVVNVNNYGNSTATVEKRQNSDGTQIDVLIDQQTANNIRKPGSKSQQALSQHMNRSLVRRS